MGGTRRLCLLSNSSHTKNDSKDENLCLPNDCNSPRVARDELILGSNRPFHKTSTITSTLGNSSQTAFQSEVPSKSPISQSVCLTSGFKTKSPQKVSKLVAERIKVPQRFSSRRVYESGGVQKAASFLNSRPSQQTFQMFINVYKPIREMFR